MNSKKILEKYRNGQCTKEEIAWIESWYNELPNEFETPSQFEVNNSFKQSWKKINEQLPKTNSYKKYLAVAASLIALTYAVIYIQNSPQNESRQIANSLEKSPGSTKATLHLNNGQVFAINTNATGDHFQKKLETLNNEHYFDYLSYLKHHESQSFTLLTQEINVIETNQGGNYQVILEDGTKIWLNSCSKLTFPRTFIGKNSREVFLSGEAYFEVNPNKEQPFIVNSKDQKVKVLGTHFNIQAFANEKYVKTTLLEGAIQLSYLKNSTGLLEEVTLKPGEQVTLQNKQLVRSQANHEQTVEWTQGNFLFNDEELASILRQLARWYNIKVDFSSVPNTKFNGFISKDVSLSKVIEMLEQTGDVKFKMENDSLRTIIKRN